mgnify:CR=1 FL=1
MSYILGNGEKFLKEVDTKDMVLHFTDNPLEAKQYTNEWFADTELDFIKFHFKDNETAQQFVRNCIYNAYL